MHITTHLCLILITIFTKPILGVSTFTSDRLILTKSSRFPPMVTRSYDQLIYATFPAYPEAIVRLESEKIGYAFCDIVFDSHLEIERPLGFDSLANGQLVLTFLGANATVGRYIFSEIVYLDKCEHVSVPAVPLNETSVTGPDDIRILMGKKEFDVFLPDHPKCEVGKACRLRILSNGEHDSWNNLDKIEDAVHWFISSVSEKDFSKGYFYTAFTNNKTVVVRLDKDLEGQSGIELGNAFLHSDLHGHVNLCRATSPYNLECDMLDENLLSRSPTAIVDTEPYRSFIRSARMFNLDDGSAWLFFVLQLHTVQAIGKEFSVYLQHIDVYGRVSTPIKFVDDLCKDFSEVTVTKMKDRFYCVNVTCRESVRTKCVIFQ